MEKGKDAVVVLQFISLSQAIEPTGTTESVTHDQCDARPTVTFLATEHHRPLAGTKLYCLVTETHVCVNNLPGAVI